MKKLLSTLVMAVILCTAGLFVGCNNSNCCTAEDFTFTYKKESATKTTSGENYNIKMEITIKNNKSEANTLAASKFTLKQNDKVVSTSVNLGGAEEEKATEDSFKSMETKDVTVNFVTAKTLTGECYLYYGETKLFTVTISSTE